MDLNTGTQDLVPFPTFVVETGFCVTSKYKFDQLFVSTEYGEGLGGTLAEGVEIASFQMV